MREQGCILSEKITDLGVEITATPRGQLKKILNEFKLDRK
jgi:hypothetical protein